MVEKPLKGRPQWLVNPSVTTYNLIPYECTMHIRCELTLFGHSHSEALLQAAVLTAVPCHLVDDAVLVPVTRVHHVLLDASAEKTLWRHTDRFMKRSH